MKRQDPRASIEETVRLNLNPEEILCNSGITYLSDNVIESVNEDAQWDVTAKYYHSTGFIAKIVQAKYKIIIIFLLLLLKLMSILFIILIRIGYYDTRFHAVLNNSDDRRLQAETTIISYKHSSKLTSLCVNFTKTPHCLNESCNTSNPIQGIWSNENHNANTLINVVEGAISIKESFQGVIEVNVTMYHSTQALYGFVVFINDTQLFRGVFQKLNKSNANTNHGCVSYTDMRLYFFKNDKESYVKSIITCKESHIKFNKSDKINLKFFGSKCIVGNPSMLIGQLLPITTTTIPDPSVTLIKVEKMKLWWSLPLFVILSIIFGYEISLCLSCICPRKVENINKQADWISELLVGVKVPADIDPTRIKRKEKIGSGHFGLVYKGVLSSKKGNVSIDVALKTVRKEINYKQKKGGEAYCLDIERKVLLYIGEHENIVKLVGAITKPCQFGQFVLITELCMFGSLESYISRRAHLYDEGRNISMEQIIENSKLCLPALILYSLQIANGANFFSNHKMLIHRDLALRNILLTGEHIVKICGFGLTVKATEYNVHYHNELPIHWLPPEALHPVDQIFTQQSDVWSFGVLLYELFTLADDMHNMVAPHKKSEFREWLLLGNRFDRPLHATNETAQLINDCWNVDSVKRPNFRDCRKVFYDELSLMNVNVLNYVKSKVRFQ